jgi:hypothetical protein
VIAVKTGAEIAVDMVDTVEEALLRVINSLNCDAAP